ncbi:prolyl-tRNA synthetase associated domain-containing protein [Pseudobacteroides cellulosolvens]|uniref:YbaK/prolyl-tRNA synthetase associated region n=1 Tax=Pseudobacteroides cellulosolvens ATCC 35603 = DSM 2933 TaxID=398512 RepID=A0A0L6JTR0_9FIRM|nr:prolyl-tRNA synthetase associated domain-containing protein [Pseudobacteroides cellulosolvens]KNY28802.1 YbaK/prolyl-tRNA synthetase associated region [Pseudobacteroides cellulosolvens ATCC 35603 = DSM 2933]
MINECEELILKTLDDLGITFTRVTHPPIYTVSEAKIYGKFQADGCKNLFFYDKTSDKYYLLVCLEDKKVHSNTVRKQVRASRLVFGSEDDLLRLLRVTPGSVSPFGIVYDESKSVTVLIDEDLPKSGMVCFHPNINTATLVLSYEDFEKFIKWSGNEYRFVKITKE